MGPHSNDFTLLKVLPEVYHCRFLYILYLKEINELLLWSGSVWTSFTLKVFCGTVCNEVQWIFSLACRVLLLSRCWFGYFFYYITEVHSWRRNYDQGQNPVWLRRCAMHQCDTPIIPFFALGLCAVWIVWVPSIAQRHIWCVLGVI